MRKYLLGILIALLFVFFVLPLGVGAAVHNEALEGLLDTLANIIQIVQVGVNGAGQAYRDYLGSL